MFRVLQSPLNRIVFSLAVLGCAYLAYAQLAVPVLEPPELVQQEPDLSPDEEAPAPNTPLRSRHNLTPYFAEGSWELTQRPQVFEFGDKAKLIIKDHTILKSGQVVLKPCSLVFPMKSEPNQPERAMILQTSEAILEFDPPFELKAPRVGRIVGGKLAGEINIYSRGVEPGSKDDIRLKTRDAELQGDRVFSPHDVLFQIGPNRGSARDMEIKLLTNADGSRQRTRIQGIQSVEFRRDVNLDLAGSYLAGEAALGGNNGPQSFRVTCQGLFRFDVTEMQAQFFDQVSIVGQGTTGPAPQMRADTLSLFFIRSTRRGSSSPMGGMEARMLRATGNPVAIDVPDREARVRSQELEYDLQTKRLSLKGSDEVVMGDQHNLIRAKKSFEYTPGQNGELPVVRAGGPGSIQWAAGKDNQKCSVNWNDELFLRADPKSTAHILSLKGDAQVQAFALASLQAADIHLWLQPDRTKLVKQAAPGIGIPDAKPIKMLAKQGVRIRSQEIRGQVEQLEAWFAPEKLPGKVPRAAANGAAGVAGPGPAQIARAPLSSEHKGKSYDVSGGTLQLEFIVRGQAPREQTELSNVTLLNKARIRQTNAEGQKDPKGLDTSGELIEISHVETDEKEVKVSGQPAIIEVQGMNLIGNDIKVDQRDNRIAVLGPGQMELPMDRDLAGQPVNPPKRLRIAWSGGLNFDGQTATFDRKVDVRMGEQDLSLIADRVNVTMAERLRFDDPSKSNRSAQPQIAQLQCSGQVWMEHRSVEAQSESIDQFRVRDVLVDLQTGRISGHGPGEVESVRRGQAPQFGGPLAQNAPADPAGGDQLNYLRVTFQRALDGVMQKNLLELTFSNRVKGVYGPVHDWNDKLEMDDPDNIGPNGMTLDCDELTVRSLTAAGNRQPRTLEMESKGSITIQGLIFRALAERLTYSQAKDLLTLSGDGRTLAKIDYQQEVGGKNVHVDAKTIRYFLKTQEIKTEGAAIDLNNLGNLRNLQPNR